MVPEKCFLLCDFRSVECQDELAKKKRVKGAHKVSTTKVMQQVAEIVKWNTWPNKTLLCTIAMNEKFERIKVLDVEVIDLIDNDCIVDVIERADEY